ncbi:unnamed protein product [Miscanthus lutarioriparius]|uniref:Uncharacterized protein n=1 Tax=Miscanthus lutarioriparius TaxID=422564 RepID=A0A811S011_9POAL|nr:unnamed protein product [Miscanthus lutarioriparius]
MPTMSITVTKSSLALVGPSTAPAAAETTAHIINLSSFDKALAFFPVTSFHIFDHAIHRPAETVRSALSRALVHYYPVAGRAVIDDDCGAELRIACTGEGVGFVAASANCSLADVKLFDPPFGALLKELAVGLGAEGFRPSDPLLLVQVTEFSCGGFVLGVTRNHVVADGTGFAQFLQAVGELARGLARPSVFPVSCGDDSLPELPPFVDAMEKAQVTLEPRDFAYLDITVPSRCINRIKAGFARHAAAADGGGPCTVFEAVMAVLWQCRTRAVMSDPETPAPLIFAVNVRKHAGAKRGYYGNCITSAVVVPTSGEVANGDINDVLRLIKRAKQPIPYQFCKNKDVDAGDEGRRHVRGLEPEGGLSLSMEQLDVTLGYNAFDVTSWRNLGADAVDFGGGRPARVMCSLDRMAVPHCVACLPCNKDGGNVLARCVREEHVDAFLGELAKFT